MENSHDKTVVHFSLVPIDYSKPYEEQPECKRHVIGAYSNLALHNMIMVVNTIMLAIGMETFKEEAIKDAFGPGHRKRLLNLDNNQKLDLQKRLYRHFTFLKRMKLEDKDKKSVQLKTLLEELSDFTSCMYDIRKFYTHYRPYDTLEETKNKLELKRRLGKKMTYLFENSCQLYKDREKLTYEDNEVFFAQREEVEYIYYWSTSKDLPEGKSFEDLKKELEKLPNHRRVDKDTGIEYTLRNDDCITGLTRMNGKKCRYTWDFSKTNYDKKRQEIDRSKENGKSRQKNVGYKILDDNGIVGEWKQFDRNLDYYAAMSDADKGLSDVGLIYFLCLFLEKQDAFDLMEEVGFTAQCTFTKDDDGENIDILQELMCLNRIRMVKSRLDTEMTDTSLAMDMIGELRKCPKQLYEVFTKEARKLFKDVSTVEWEEEHQQEAIPTEETRSDQEETDGEILEHAESKNIPKSTFVRWQDRFPQMALNYIDTRCLFEDIRFQLDLGKYRYAFYHHEKDNEIVGEKQLRILQKELHGFGRIQEVEQEIKNRWKSIFEKKYEEGGLLKKKPDVEGQRPYVTEQRPQYGIDEKSHSIGLRWEGWDNDCRNSNNNDLKSHHLGSEGLDRKKMFIPYLPVNTGKSEKDPQKTNRAENLLPPQAMLNLYDLPGLLFYQYLLEKYGSDYHIAESVIKDKVSELKKFFTYMGNGSLSPIDVEPISEKDWRKLTDDQRAVRKAFLSTKLNNEGFSLNISEIPDKLCKYLLNISIDNNSKLYDSALGRLKERQKDVELSLHDYREKKKRIGTKNNSFNKMHATIKTGSLASELMSDIMDWIPLNGEARKNLTGQKFMALQAALAMLGQEFEDESGNKKMVTRVSLKEMMTIAKIIDSGTEGSFHPFLSSVFQKCKDDSVENFYEQYLFNEIAHIKTVRKELEDAHRFSTDLNKSYRQVPFLHHERARWRKANDGVMQELAKGYLKLPLQLPNGLFANDIYRFLKDLPKDSVPQDRWSEFINKLEEADKGEEHNRLSNNISYLISLYIRYIEDDQSQPFYNTDPIDDSPSPYRHVYRVFKKYFGEPSPTRQNQKTMPEYTISEIRNILKDKERLSTMILDTIADEVNKFESKLTEKSFVLKEFTSQQWKIVMEENYSGKVRRNYQQRQEEVNRRVEEKKKELIEEFKASLIKKQEHEFKKVNNNERVIRRYKVQDILMFIMARQILKQKIKEKDFGSEFKLKNLMSGSLLEKTIDFELDLYIKKNGKIEKKTIIQEDMKLKDYGHFYKFLTDPKRVTTLLSRLSESSFPRAMIENEFSYYDSNRSEVFRIAYCIESEAYRLCPYLTDDANANPKDNDNDFYYKNDRDKLVAKRNNFYNLLAIVIKEKVGEHDDNIINLLQSIRNSFGHNTYEVDLPAVFEGREDHMKLPEVANGMKDKMKNETDKKKETNKIKTEEP